MSEAENLETLAKAQAAYKLLGDALSPKNPDSYRSAADAWLIDLYETTGIDRVSLQVGGEEVGKYVVKKSKPTKRTTLFVNDAGALVEDEPSMLAAFARRHADEFARFVLEETGAVPDGCELSVEDVPGRVIGTAITGCKPDVVLPLLGASDIAGLLGGK